MKRVSICLLSLFFLVYGHTQVQTGTLIFPRLVNSDREITGIAIANLSDLPAPVTFTAFDDFGQMIRGSGVSNPVTVTIPPRQQLARLASEIFGPGFTSRSGWLLAQSANTNIAGFFLTFDPPANFLDGADVTDQTYTDFAFVEIEGAEINLVNPGPREATASLTLVDAQGRELRTISRTIPSRGRLASRIDALFSASDLAFGASLFCRSTEGLAAFEVLGNRVTYISGLNGQPIPRGSFIFYAPQFVFGGGFKSKLSVVNLDTAQADMILEWFNDLGEQIGQSFRVLIPGRGKITIGDPSVFGVAVGRDIIEGYIRIEQTQGTRLFGAARLGGSVIFSDTEGNIFQSALPLVIGGQRQVVFSQVAESPDFFTGVAIVNLSGQPANVMLEVFDSTGRLTGRGQRLIVVKGRESMVLSEVVPNLRQLGGYFRVISDVEVSSFALFGFLEPSPQVKSLAAIPAQVLRN